MRVSTDGRHANLETIAALVRRAANELLRVPGRRHPGGARADHLLRRLTAVFGHLTLLPGFTTEQLLRAS